MISRKSTIPKTARYVLSAEPSEKTEEIWFVCHGYGQLANYFIRNFEGLNNESTVIVAPEGLHRFYLSGFSGRVGASWMTKEAREDDITDYVNYLDIVYHEVLSLTNSASIKINILGFSQGTATVCRWIAAGNVKADNLIIWAGAFPEDMDLNIIKAVFNKLKTYIIIGDQDEFINAGQVQKQELILQNAGINYKILNFKGKHEIDQDALMTLNKLILS